MNAIHGAQGKGCSLGYLGVCVGGDRALGYEHAKAQLFRSAFDKNPNPQLARLEERITMDANELGIGTLGFGGNVTLMGCKIGFRNRLPASYFVTVAYQCWAFRRLGVVLDAKTGAVKKWLHRDDNEIARYDIDSGFKLTGKEVVIKAPVTQDT